MKYDKEITQKLISDYESGMTVKELSAMMTLSHGEPVPDRSIIAKLSSLGVYRKKEYLTKRGEIPIKKEEYIERIAKLLDVNAEILERLEKVNKSVLALIENRLTIDPYEDRQRQIAPLVQPPINYFYGSTDINPPKGVY